MLNLRLADRHTSMKDTEGVEKVEEGRKNKGTGKLRDTQRPLESGCKRERMQRNKI